MTRVPILRPWHPTAHHFGLYTFDNCSTVGCEDPCHTAPDDGSERDAAEHESLVREAAKVAKQDK